LVIGHQKVIDFLNKSIVGNRLAHAYLFSGPAHLGKMDVALEFAKALQCDKKHLNFSSCGKCQPCLQAGKNTHPDILIVEPLKEEIKEKIKEKEISIEQIRQVRQQLGLFPYYGQYKIIIINRAEKMTREAASALLKTLEEPSAKTTIILVSSAPRTLLPTIISRCLTIRFGLARTEEITAGLKKIGCAAKEAAMLAKVAGNKPGLALEYFKNPALLKEREKEINQLASLLKKDLSVKFKYAENLAKDIFSANKTLSEWQIFFRDLLLEKLECPELVFSPSAKDFADKNKISPPSIKKIIEDINKIKKIIGNSSFNARLALENLMLNIS
jgi:DNA polymerase-3 subunit delta'